MRNLNAKNCTAYIWRTRTALCLVRVRCVANESRVTNAPRSRFDHLIQCAVFQSNNVRCAIAIRCCAETQTPLAVDTMQSVFRDTRDRCVIMCECVWTHSVSGSTEADPRRYLQTPQPISRSAKVGYTFSLSLFSLIAADHCRSYWCDVIDHHFTNSAKAANITPEVW